ncbi:uncharacterized protein LOC113271545 [Papaver somniferum]|uniref:uncharacterized protein LOC113271545 n=1 Tax=Papaver somniferum TaxID=3469 RepID=UPI000E700244|nr:uncharacterized protein LOC113271545 [Papaver somniferum]
MRYNIGSRRRRLCEHGFLLICGIITGFGLLVLTLRSIDQPPPYSTSLTFPNELNSDELVEQNKYNQESDGESGKCATVEEMGESFAGDGHEKESLRVRQMIRYHFILNGPTRVRELPPEEFCEQGFVLGKASEAGFGNEMYKILTGAALSIMLNRSLIIGQTRGNFPFGEHISYSDVSFTLKEVKHLWRQNNCTTKHGKLLIRTDDFEKPAETNVLCGNWRNWKHPIIWFQGTTDAVGAQFFLKNIHPQMRNAAVELFGQPGYFQSRPNVFGELMRVIISPTKNVEEAVNWVLGGGPDPDIVLHMRMLSNRSVRAVQAALSCIQKAVRSYESKMGRPRIVLVSDTPSLIKDITPMLREFAEVLHFDYESFKGDISNKNGGHQLEFRVNDWGPAPRWVAFVDFFLASRAKHAVISGAHRRVGTTYAQLIAGLAAAQQLDENSSSNSSFSFLSSFQSSLLSEGLRNQVGWGHVWNRFAGPLSCRHQPGQCALTPLLPPGWWDGDLQSPLVRDIHKLESFGVQLTSLGEVNETHLHSFCKLKKDVLKTLPVFRKCQGTGC